MTTYVSVDGSRFVGRSISAAGRESRCLKPRALEAATCARARVIGNPPKTPTE